MAEGRSLIGLNEIKLGVPVPYPADCILRELVGSRNAREIVESGEFYQPQEAQIMGFIDKVFPIDEVKQEACEQALALGSLPSNAFSAIKSTRVELVESQILARLDEKERSFIELWYSQEARLRLMAAMDKF
jgi:enoyl-CoA hydratase/carnithine racemase